MIIMIKLIISFYSIYDKCFDNLIEKYCVYTSGGRERKWNQNSNCQYGGDS